MSDKIILTLEGSQESLDKLQPLADAAGLTVQEFLQQEAQKILDEAVAKKKEEEKK